MTIAPNLRKLYAEEPHDLHIPEYAPSRAEFRALLAVARAAKPMLRSRGHYEWATLKRAISRLERLSAPASSPGARRGAKRRAKR